MISYQRILRESLNLIRVESLVKRYQKEIRIKIGIHNHFYPTRFLKQLEKDGQTVGITIEKDEWDRQIPVQQGNRVVTITTPMREINQ